MKGTPSIIVYGPPGSGKSTNAKRIAEMYDLKYVHDEWDGKGFEDYGVLYLSADQPSNLKQYTELVFSIDLFVQKQPGQ